MKRRFLNGGLIILMIVLLASAILTGCTEQKLQDPVASDESQKINVPSEEATEENKQEQEITQDNNDLQGTISLWGFIDENVLDMIVSVFDASFKAQYPGSDIKVEQTYVAAENMSTKLQTVLASGGQLPDIIMMESSYRGKLISLDYWEDLREYGIQTESMLDYLIPISTNDEGELVGVEQAASFAGLAYKRELVKEYFGTDEPTELEKMIPDWDAFIEKGKEVKEKSSGSVYMFTGIDQAYNILKGQDSTPYVVDGKLNLKDTLKPIFMTLVKMTQAGIVDKVQEYTAPWFASYTTDSHIFYDCATWSVAFVIKQADPEGSGDWGLIVPPNGPVVYGGTIMGIPESAENKELAVKFIEWYSLSNAGADMNKQFGFFTPLKSIYEDPNYFSSPDEFFGGQDILNKFAEMATTVIMPRSINDYDQEIEESIKIGLAVINASEDGNVDIDSLISQIEEDLLEKTDLVID